MYISSDHFIVFFQHNVKCKIIVDWRKAKNLNSKRLSQNINDAK